MVYRLIDHGRGEEAIGKTENLSVSGCRFSTPDFLEVEDLLEIRISTARGIVFADAVVVFSNKQRCNGYQVGAQFVRLLPDARILLEQEFSGLGPPRFERCTHLGNPSSVNGSRAQVMKALRLTHQGDCESAIEFFEENIPKLLMGGESDQMVSDFAYSFYGVCLAKVRHRYAEAVEYCNISLRSDFADAIHLYNLAKVHLERDDRKGAVKTLNTGLLLQPDNQWINSMIDRIGRRRESAISFLSRSNRINILLGRIRHRSKKNHRKPPAVQSKKGR